MNIGQVLENNGWKRSSVRELRLFRKNGWEAYYCENYLYLDHVVHGEHTVDLKDMNIQEVEKKFSISSEK